MGPSLGAARRGASVWIEVHLVYDNCEILLQKSMKRGRKFQRMPCFAFEPGPCILRFRPVRIRSGPNSRVRPDNTGLGLPRPAGPPISTGCTKPGRPSDSLPGGLSGAQRRAERYLMVCPGMAECNSRLTPNYCSVPA